MAERTQIQKQISKKNANQMLEGRFSDERKRKRAEVYEKGLTGVGKGFAAGSFFPVNILEGVSQGALTPPASYKAATMRPTTPADLKIDPGSGKLVRKTPPPVINPEYKGTYEDMSKRFGIEPETPEAIAGSFFSLDPMAKAHAIAMGTKLLLSKFAGLGMGAAMFGGLKKVGKADDVARPIFTSPGGAAAADISKETIPANKVRSQLEGRGVNKDEMEWTGFNEWIKDKKGEVSKAEIEEFFVQNQIEVREVLRGGISQAKMEKIATDEVLHDLSQNYRDQIVEKIIQKQADEIPGGINDPAVKRAFEESSVSSQGFLKWDEMTRQNKEGFATRYRLDNDLPGLPESADDVAKEEYDLLLRSWGEGTITEAEMNQLDEMFEGVGSYYDGEMQRTVVPEGSFVDRMYQNTLAEIESGEYPIEHLNLGPDALPTRYSSPQWQLPGGENYRELVLMVPPKKVPWTKENVTEVVGGGLDHDNFYFFKTPDGLQKRGKKQNKATDYLDDDAPMPPPQAITKEEALQQVLERQPDPRPRYTGGHFEENDVVAHIRFNERVDPDGNKVLFIEEIQGDWAHKGEAEGFYTKASKEVEKRMGAIGKRQVEIKDELQVPQTVTMRKLDPVESNIPDTVLGKEGQRKLDAVIDQINKWFRPLQWKKKPSTVMEDGEAWAWYRGDERIGGEYAEKEMAVAAMPKAPKELTDKAEEIARTYDPKYKKDTELIDEYNSLTKEYDEIKNKEFGYVPEGPFVTDTHQWTNLALKRMIRWGSDNGFDSIAWVTGKQSAERYKVSKQISEVHWQGTDFTAYDHSGNRVIQQTGVTEKGLEELIGKEPAKKLMAQPNLAPPTSNMQQRKLSGLDLDIGGEYHKLIYDQVLTAQAKKIGKKHGAKVEEGVVGRFDKEVRKRGTMVQQIDSRGEPLGDWYVYDPKYELVIDQKYYKTEAEAKEALDKMWSPHREKVWSMRLTDKLKQASREGMPYYVALPPLVIGGAAAQRTDAQRQQSKTDAQQILAQ